MSDTIRTSTLFTKSLGCLMGGLIGDAIGTPSEGMDYRDIKKKYGWISDFDCDGTDDTVMKMLLADALVNSDGRAGADEWAQVWLDQWTAIFGDKVGKFFQSVLHTAAKLRRHSIPRMVPLGNMPSSSSAMCISPVGIINACNPAQAARQAYEVASLIHIHDVGFCQDGAAAIAAAVAEAFRPDASTKSITQTAQEVLMPLSGVEMRDCIEKALAVATDCADFKEFRKRMYEGKDIFFRRITCDSRETVPITFALFSIADGDVEKAVTFGANFGRDADTIASMCGSIAGAFQGADGIKPEWREKVKQVTAVDQEALAESLARAGIAKLESDQVFRDEFRHIMSQ